jgi:hypothetical protein
MIFSLYLRIPTSCETSWRIRDTRQGASSRSGVAGWGSNFFSKSLGAEPQCPQVNGRNETHSWHSSLFLLHERNPGSSGWRWFIDAPSDKRFYNVSNIRNRLQFDKFDTSIVSPGVHIGSTWAPLWLPARLVFGSSSPPEGPGCWCPSPVAGPDEFMLFRHVRKEMWIYSDDITNIIYIYITTRYYKYVFPNKSVVSFGRMELENQWKLCWAGSVVHSKIAEARTIGKKSWSLQSTQNLPALGTTLFEPEILCIGWCCTWPLGRWHMEKVPKGNNLWQA